VSNLPIIVPKGNLYYIIYKDKILVYLVSNRFSVNYIELIILHVDVVPNFQKCIVNSQIKVPTIKNSSIHYNKIVFKMYSILEKLFETTSNTLYLYYPDPNSQECYSIGSRS